MGYLKAECTALRDSPECHPTIKC